MMVLGVNCGHDSSCALVQDGIVIADVQEERFSRIKHAYGVPLSAIEFCLRLGGLSDLSQVDLLALGGIDTSFEFRAYLGVDSAHEGGAQRTRRSFLKPPLYLAPHAQVPAEKIISIEHHQAHAASAHFTRSSPDACLVFTLDGAGDRVSTMVWRSEGNTLEPLAKYGTEASFGWGYSAVTEALGWWHGDSEGKTMGLAAYGDSSRCKGLLDEFFPAFDGTNLVRSSILRNPFHWPLNGAMHWHFDEAYRIRELCARYGRENVAAEAQRKLEECVGEFVYSWLQKVDLRRAAFAGGVFLNVKLNQALWARRGRTLVEQHVFPNSGDAGLALGSAMHVYHDRSSHPFRGCNMKDLFWGPEYLTADIEQLLKRRSLEYVLVQDPSVTAAKLLAKGLIVGRFSGRMESGPRGLGNRSILMSPQHAKNKDTLNGLVKFRESFRPFCPSMLWDMRDRYLIDSRDEFFMITAFHVTEAAKDKMPAVIHVDGTARPQLVKREHNEGFWRLIEEFGRITGVYAVLNTSLNIKGEPIINTPNEALRCFFDTGMDALFMEDILMIKSEKNKTMIDVLEDASSSSVAMQAGLKKSNDSR